MRKKGFGDIVKVADLFETYRKRLRAPQGVVIDTFIEVVNDLFAFKIPKEYITYSVHSRTLKVNTNSQVKTEILLQKAEILTHMQGRLGVNGSPKEIL